MWLMNPGPCIFLGGAALPAVKFWILLFLLIGGIIMSLLSGGPEKSLPLN
jgi:hypothetical protein